MNTVKDFSRYQDNFVVVHPGSDQPEISIVMPIYNCEEFVASAIASVLAQQDIVAEILISDDASTDDTFAVAYQTVIDYIGQIESKHTVRMRAGISRLQRDHLHLLAKTASCDLVCQAHGDDISHPLRCSVLVRAFNQQDKKTSMIFVNSSVIDDQGNTVGEPKNSSLSDIRVEAVEYNKIIKAHDDTLIGSNMAWRKSSFEVFPQLTTSYCTYGHDRVMTFRSFLVGGCCMLDAPLLKKRLHSNQWHKELLSSNHKSVNLFNYQLIRLSLFSTMKKDLIFLKENDLLEEDDFNQHSHNVHIMIAQAINSLTDATGDLVADGYVNKWIKES